MIKLEKSAIKKLQALRAGPMTSSEMTERFGNSMGLKPLVAKGLIAEKDGIYKITESGRANCPNRVTNMPPAAKSVTKKQPAALVTLQAAPPIRTTLKTESETEMSNKKTETPTALLMLQCIGAYPDLTMPEIAKLIGKDCGPSYIPSYIERGHVLIEVNDNQKKSYRLADGMTAQEIYNYKKLQKEKELQAKIAEPTAPNSEQDKVPQFTASAEDKDYVLEVHSPAEMLDAVNKMCAQATVDMLGEHAHEVLNPKVNLKPESAKSVEAPSQPPKIRFAITSEHTLIIQNLSFADIELSQEDTAALVEFIESASLILPVDSGFKLGGARL